MSLSASSSLLVLIRTVRLGADNVRSHTLRSVLTVLGIVFGVCSVISMLSIGEGASQEVQDQIRRLGSLNIIIKSNKPPDKPGEEQSKNFIVEYGLTYDDSLRLAESLPNTRVIVPLKASAQDLWMANRKVTAQVVATVPWFFQEENMKLIAGHFISPLELERLSNVCVLSQGVARDLFLFEDPIDKAITIDGDVYRVVGIVDNPQPNGAAQSGELASLTAECFIPITTLRARKGDYQIRRQQGSMSAERIELSELIVTVKNQQDVLPAAALIEDMLKRYHTKQDYKLIIPLRLLEEARKTQRIFSIVLGAIAAISLLVGGIGIMNIMLASVSERTREIGIRRALGARRRDIMFQFLVETLILSVGGGVLGMGLGVLIPWVVTRLSGLKTVLTVEAFILSFFVSAFIGVVFGLYPARRAALMDPIDALRHE